MEESGRDITYGIPSSFPGTGKNHDRSQTLGLRPELITGPLQCEARPLATAQKRSVSLVRRGTK
jgi:hypothetical protein